MKKCLIFFAKLWTVLKSPGRGQAFLSWRILHFFLPVKVLTGKRVEFWRDEEGVVLYQDLVATNPVVRALKKIIYM